MEEFFKKIFVNVLKKIASPFLKEGKYLRLPKDKKKRFIFVFIFMMVVMIASLFYLWLLSALEDFL